MSTTLKECRMKKALTQKQVAARVSISERSYQYYETGERMPDVQTAIRISRALNSTVEDLWDGNPTPQAAFLL